MTNPYKDSYQFTKNVPRYGFKDDVEELIDVCHRLNYGVYMFGGMVMQIEAERYIMATTRWFISFTELNNGKQIFCEASGNGRVYSVKHDPDAFKHFLAFLQENVDKWKVI